MGQKLNKDIPEELLEDYQFLTYLHKQEILKILKRFNDYYPNIMKKTPFHRFEPEEILLMFPEFKVNPFWPRLVWIFSSYKDHLLSFEDMLDMFSALSSNCPEEVKSAWAFKMFDFDNDGLIGSNDIIMTIQSITGKYDLNDNCKDYVALEILSQMDLAQTGGVTALEFRHALVKMPDFAHCFQITL